MDIRSNLTIRYGIALGLVAAVLVSTHLIASERIGAARQDGRLIDTSGMQRMLSQRIALLVIEVHGESDSSRRASYEKQLGEAIERMAANHAELLADWRRRVAAGESHYAAYLGADGIEAGVERYLDAARALMPGSGSEADGGATRDEALQLGEVALDGVFLAELNAVVQRYTRESEARADTLRGIQTAALVVGLLILLFEMLFIFRPMVSRVSWCIRVLDEANEELRTLAGSISRDLRAPIVDSIGLIRNVDEALTSGRVVEASAATRNVYSSMITLDGVLNELIEVVGRQRGALVNFATLGRRRKADDEAVETTSP